MFGRWLEKNASAFKQFYLNNLIPNALRAQGGYDGRKIDSFVCPRSRAWVEWGGSDMQNEQFTVGGYILDKKMKQLVDYIFPGILEEAEACFKAYKLRGTESAVPGAVVSQSNMLFSELLAYSAVLWLQVILFRL